MKSLSLMLVLGLAAAAPAGAHGSHGKQASASIPFVNHGGIRDWRATDDRTLYVQAQGGGWYVAKLANDCLGLTYEDSIGFDASGTDTFDKFSSLVVRGQRCPVQSLTPIAGPPSSSKPHKQAKP